MDAKLVVSPEAEQDLAEAYAWYEQQRPGLGEDFLSCVDARFRALCRTPEIYPVVADRCRRALVRRFPYAIFFEQIGDAVNIYCVFHTSRDPDKWRRRLP